MYKSTLLLLTSCLLLWGCPQNAPEPEKDDRIPLPEYGVSTFFSNSQYNPDPSPHVLTNTPKCGEPAIIHQNIKFSIQAASNEESPLLQKCVDVHNRYGTYFYIGAGSAFVADVSYYSGIKRITVGIGLYCGSGNPVAIYLYDREARLIESRDIPAGVGSGFQDIDFDKNLSNLAEIRSVDRCEGGIYRLTLYDR